LTRGENIFERFRNVSEILEIFEIF